jgi:hypothetical protein
VQIWHRTRERMQLLPMVAISGVGQSIRPRAAMVSFRAHGFAQCVFVMLPDHFTSYGIFRSALCLSSVALPHGDSLCAIL